MAALSDLETSEWRELFSLLEREQAEFLALESRFRSPEYKWPRDPLHTWSRVWEYPYAYHHLRKWRRSFSGPGQPHVADVGSGVTFFPFSVARLGCQVTCTDIDPICERDLQRAAALVNTGPGKVTFRLCSQDRLPFADEELDAVYCISVLEHIPEFEKTIAEISRVLKPGGLLVLTIDLDLRGDSEIGPVPHRRLVTALREQFHFHFSERITHPADVLNTSNGPFTPPLPRGLAKTWFLFKQRLKPLFGRKPSTLPPFFLTIQGFVLNTKTEAVD